MAKWKAGIKAPWPPRPALRFDIGARVECRIGPHPVKGSHFVNFGSMHYFQIHSVAVFDIVQCHHFSFTVRRLGAGARRQTLLF